MTRERQNVCVGEQMYRGEDQTADYLLRELNNKTDQSRDEGEI